MKKVGILTFHNAINYGACLQAYALKEVLKNKKVNVEIIDYKCEAINDFYYKTFVKEDSLKTKIKKILTFNIQKKRNKEFNKFISNNLLDFSNQKKYNKSNIKEVNKEFEKIIVGSDQVWSPFCTGNDLTYFLNFIQDSNKKFSYAACLGITKDDFYKKNEVKKLLNDFKFISVRENSAKERLSKILERKDINTSIDPTFLLTAEQWNQIILTKSKKEKYILVYSLSMPKEVLDFAYEVSAKTGYKIIYITLDNLFTIKKYKNTITKSPSEFIEYIKDAEYVITNSFHGTAFSIIFNKKFFTIKNSNPNHDNSRLYDLLESLGLEDRIYLKYNDLIINKNINYKEVNNKISKLRNKSLDYIDSILNK